jgi:lysozyme
MSFIEQVADQIIEHEGMRLFVYDDATGKQIEAGTKVLGNPTIGIGRLLTKDRGISHDEAVHLLSNDLRWVAEKAEGYGFWHKLDSARQMVVMNMIFNLGNRFDKFKKMIAALEQGDYKTASVEMLDSNWAQQVKSRSTVLAKQMETGVMK